MYINKAAKKSVHIKTLAKKSVHIQALPLDMRQWMQSYLALLGRQAASSYVYFGEMVKTKHVTMRSPMHNYFVYIPEYDLSLLTEPLGASDHLTPDEALWVDAYHKEK